MTKMGIKSVKIFVQNVKKIILFYVYFKECAKMLKYITRQVEIRITILFLIILFIFFLMILFILTSIILFILCNITYWNLETFLDF